MIDYLESDHDRLASTVITVGNNTDVTLNAVCASNIDRAGVYICNPPLTGTFLGLYRADATIIQPYHIAEVRAYPYLPFGETCSPKLHADSSYSVNDGQLIESLRIVVTDTFYGFSND